MSKKQKKKKKTTSDKAASRATWVGRVDHVSSRYAYISIPDETQDVYVQTANLRSAVHADTVAVQPLVRRYDGQREGRVTRVVRRNRHRFVGRVKATRQGVIVVPDFKKIHQDFFIPAHKTHGASPFDKVVFDVVKWGAKRRDAEAEIVRILGKTGEHEAEMHSIISEFELPLEFAPEALQEAENIPDAIPPAEIKKRRDFRSVLTFTIDPEDAKDFDDALSWKPLDNGRYEIGIHIADVSHYVKPDTALDQAAYRRATSVYLVDRTLPMLPERLSNRVCSLMPNVDRLTLSAVFEMDKKGRIYRRWFGKTVIHSRRRLTYEEAQQAIEGKEGPYAPALGVLNAIARCMRKARIEDGAIDFETTEVKFVLDQDHKPVHVVTKERKEAHKLVEEFMLIANRAVAQRVFDHIQKNKRKEVFVFRAHEAPDMEKVADFARFAKQFGYRIEVNEKTIAHSINALIKKIAGRPEEHALQQLAIRTMAKAVYTTRTIGHFGLAFQRYTHFTSPIRRYPDLMAHRMLMGYLKGDSFHDQTRYEARCAHCSEREKRAADAERASVKYKQVELMSLAPQKAYKGMITGVTDFGVFIEIRETRCEGMIRLRDLKDDFYELDEKNFRVVGRRRKKALQLGDEVKVSVKKTDIDRRIIDLYLISQ